MSEKEARMQGLRVETIDEVTRPCAAMREGKRRRRRVSNSSVHFALRGLGKSRRRK
jgi:hypothetical protein